MHFRLLGRNGFQVKAENKRFYLQNLKYENFTFSFGGLRKKIPPKRVPHVQHDYFSSFNQSNYRFVALSLPLLKRLRRQLQGKRLIKIELCVKLSLLRLFHFDHVVQNRWSALSLAWHEWFSCKGKEEKIYCCELPSSTEPQI